MSHEPLQHRKGAGYLTPERSGDARGAETHAADLGCPRREAEGPPLDAGPATKPPGAHSYAIAIEDWSAVMVALDGRDADVIVEAKSKERALVPLGFRVE